MHAVEVPFESIDVRGPEPAELRQPRIHLSKRFWLQPVETALCVHRRFDETGVAQHAQVFGDRRLRHTKFTLDFSHRLLRRDQEAQDRAPVRLGNDFEGRFHGFIYSIEHMRVKVYTNRRCSEQAQREDIGEPVRLQKKPHRAVRDPGKQGNGYNRWCLFWKSKNEIRLREQ